MTTNRKKRYGPTRIRCMNETLRHRLNTLIFHGFSPIMCKKIMMCLFQCRISEMTIKRHRRFLFNQVGETFKDFKERNKELEHGRGGYLPERYLDLYQPPSEYLVTIPKKEKQETIQKEPMYVAGSELETEIKYGRKKTKTLIGKPL